MPIQEITQSALSPSDNSTGITTGGWIVWGVLAAWISIIYVFAFRYHKAQQKAEEKRQRERHEHSLETRQEEFSGVEGGV
jgi:uncharacterized protein HemX